MTAGAGGTTPSGTTPSGSAPSGPPPAFALGTPLPVAASATDQRARRRPPLTTAALAIPAGALVAGRLAVGFALLVFLPDTLIDPSPLGGTGSPDIMLYAALWASMIGAALGVLGGAVLAGVTAVLWMLRAPSAVVAAVGGMVTTAVSFALIVSWATWNPQSVALAALGATSGVGGAILLAWAGDVRAGIRPGWR